MSEKVGICVLCGLQATLMCQRCYECYCSVKCQIEDWAKHKLICIPLPTLVPLQQIKLKKVSVNARLDRSNFLNNSMEDRKQMTHHYPLRIPRRYSQSGNHFESANATNLEIIKKNIHLPPSKEDSGRFSEPIPPANNLRRTQNDQNDMPRMAKQDTNKYMNYSEESKKDSTNKNGSPNTYNDNSVDLFFRVEDRICKDEPISKSVDHITNSLDNALSFNKSDKNNKSQKAWKNHFPFENNNFFEVVVQYVSEKDSKLVWVTDASHVEACNSLFREINKNIKPETDACSAEMIYVGNVVAAPFFGFYYRAIILEEKNSLNKVRVRLSDYGNDFYVNINQLKPPIPSMKNLNSFAFCIKYNGKAVNIGNVLKIKIIRKEYDDVYKIEEKVEEKEELFIQINVVNVFKQIYGIVIVEQKEALNQLSKMREVLAGDTANKFMLALPPVEGSFIVGKTSAQWERGFLLSSYESYFIMYCIDIGQIELVREVKSVPKEFKNIPRLALLITTEKGVNLEKYSDDGSKLELKSIKTDGTTNYELYCNASKLAANVTVSTNWNGNFTDISIKYWLAGPQQNDEVQITHIHGPSEVSVCKYGKGEIYSEIFDQKGREAIKTDAVKDKIVLAFNKSRFVRCIILDKLPNEVRLLDLDSGESFTAKDREIKEADNFARYAPVFVIKAPLLYLNKINTSRWNMAVALLQSSISEKKKFTISFVENAIDLLIDANTSYNKQLIPFFFEKITTEEINIKKEKVQEDQNAIKEKVNNGVTQEVQKDVQSKKIFYVDDIELIPIRTGQSAQILVLDDSMIADGMITGCDFIPEMLIKFETEYANNIMKYCMDPSIPQEYSPKDMEVCFSIYEEDNQWYRAVCLNKYSDDEFLILFLDYGNTTLKTKKDLRKITKDFLYPTNANSCIIEGLPQAMSEELLESIKSVVYTDAVLTPKNVEKVGDSYSLTIEEVIKLLP